MPFLAYSLRSISLSATFTATFSDKAIRSAWSRVITTAEVSWGTWSILYCARETVPASKASAVAKSLILLVIKSNISR